MLDRPSSLKGYFFSRLPGSLLRRLAHIIDSAPFMLACLCVLLVPLGIGLFYSVIYIAAFLYGLLSGQSFPCQEIFLFVPGLTAVFSLPTDVLRAPFLTKALLAYACAGFFVSLLLQREQQSEVGRRFLSALGKQWNAVSGLLIFSLLFTTFAEVFFAYTSDSGFFTFGGSIPFSDAAAFYGDYSEYFYNGVMSDHGLRRPVAAFMGASIYGLAGNDPATAVQVQCLLLCCAMWVSCAVMNKFFGVWSAIGCLALQYGYCCQGKFSFTFMTEPLGFFWGGIAAALWLQALREKRLFWDLAAFSATLVGLLARMGIMFLIPALFLYILWRWRELAGGVAGWWKKPLCGLCVCVVAIALLNTLFSSRGVGDTQQTGSNFAYSFVGLTLGTNWYEGRKHYAAELQRFKDEKQKSIFLYKQAFENIIRSPRIFFSRLVEGEWSFIKNFDFLLFRSWGLVWFVGALLVIRRKILFTKASAVYWIAVWLGILPSIPFVYFDAYPRAVFFVFPLIACFFSLVFAKRHNLEASTESSMGSAAAWVAVSLSCSLLLLMVSVALFPRLHTSADTERILKYRASVPKEADNRFLVDARNMGFLVVPDGEKAVTEWPSMTWSTFKDRYKKYSPSVYEDLLSEDFPKPPFAVLTSLPVDRIRGDYNYFIAPLAVMTQKDVLLWDFETAGKVNAPKGKKWNIVDKAVPVLYK